MSITAFGFLGNGLGVSKDYVDTNDQRMLKETNNIQIVIYIQIAPVMVLFLVAM